MKKIIWVIGVLRRAVVTDWRFDNLCGSHLLKYHLIKTEKESHYHCVGNYKKRKTEKKYINIIALLGIKKTKLKKKTTANSLKRCKCFFASQIAFIFIIPNQFTGCKLQNCTIILSFKKSWKIWMEHYFYWWEQCWTLKLLINFDHLPHCTVIVGFLLYLCRKFGIELSQKSTFQYRKLVKLFGF